MVFSLWLHLLLALVHICGHQVNSIVVPVSSVASWKHPSGGTADTKDPAVVDDYQEGVVKPPCSCGGPGGWTRVAHLDMDDPKQQCPSNWTLLDTGTLPSFRGCGRSSTQYGSCDSAFFPVHGRKYSSVCGRAVAIQRGSSYAFCNTTQSNFTDINTAYVSGLSVTHGLLPSRQHIWTFAGAMTKLVSMYTNQNCPCSNTNITWTYSVPPFVGSDYFCDTANPFYEYWLVSKTFFVDDPLWDGKGCVPYSKCCSFNCPPWFCKTLPEPTSDDLEIRLCCKSLGDYEDKLIRLIDIYVK